MKTFLKYSCENKECLINSVEYEFTYQLSEYDNMEKYSICILCKKEMRRLY